MKKGLSIIIVLTVIVSLFGGNALGETFTDIKEDWAKDALEKAVDNGLLIGDEDLLRPDAYLTRAEMATVLNRMFGQSAKVDLGTYVDLEEAAWYYDQMAMAVQKGFFVGYESRLEPTRTITREEAFIVMARALKLTGGSNEILDVYLDSEEIGFWALDAMASMVEAGYANGYEGYLRPKDKISRKEFAALIDKVIKGYISTEGEFVNIPDGNIMINSPNVVLRNVTVNGDLIIGDGVGDGDVTLDNVIVAGRTVIRGGGENSIKITGTSSMRNIIISRVSGKIRVYNEYMTEIGEVVVDGKDDVVIEGKVTNITVLAKDISLNLKNTVADSLTIKGESINLDVDSGSSLKSVLVSAKGSAINVDGQVTTIDVEGEDTSVTGTGSVELVNANADNTVVTTPDTDVAAGQGTTGVIAGDTPVEEGSSTSTPTTSTTSSGGSSADTSPPSGYSVAVDQAAVNNSNKTAVSFTFVSAEVGATYNYSIDDTNGGTAAVTGNGTVSTATDQIAGIDVSGLDDDTLTLTVYLTDTSSNQGADVTDTVTKDVVLPSGYSVSIDQADVNNTNQTTASFTFAAGEVGAAYNYSFDDTNGGTSAVTGSGTISTATDQITGIDVSGLDDDTLTLTVYLTDTAGNQGNNVTDTVVKESQAPSGYSVSYDQAAVNNSNKAALSFTFTAAEVGATYNYSIDDTNGGTVAVTGSGTISTATDQITGIDVSGLDDDTLTLTVYLTDVASNQGSNVTDTISKDVILPSGYSVSLDQANISNSNKTALSFTFAGAEVGTSYNYSVDDTNGGTAAVTGSGSISTATDQITGINVSGLDDDTLTLTVYLTDTAGNQGSNSTDTVVKDATAPGGYSVVYDQSSVNNSNKAAISFTFASAEVGATYNYSIDDTNGGTAAVTGSGTISTATDQISSIDVSGLDDDILTLTVYLTDTFSNQGSNVTDTINKDTVLPGGYSVSLDQALINNSNKTSLSFTFAGAEVGATYNYSIDDTNGGTAAVTGSGTISTATDQISSIDVSGLDDDTLALTVYLTDTAGNQGSNSTDTVVKDATAPSGYSVVYDQSAVNNSNKTAISFTFAGAEVGATYNYSIDDTNGGTAAVTGSGTISTATDQISSIDVSGLDDDTLTLTVYLTDTSGNQGSNTTDTIVKDVIAPSGYSVTFDQASIDTANKTAISFTFAGAEVGATYYYSIDDTNGVTAAITGNGTISTATDQITGLDVSSLDDDTITLTVYLVDAAGNQGSNATHSVTKAP